MQRAFRIEAALAGILGLVVATQAIKRTIEWDKTSIDAVWISWLALASCIGLIFFAANAAKPTQELQRSTASALLILFGVVLFVVFVWAISPLFIWCWDDQC